MAKHVFTIDVLFDDIENLKKSVEETRKSIDELKKFSDYYLMIYTKELKLGIKIILNQDSFKEISGELKIKLNMLKGFKGISQETDNGEVTEENYLCSIAMKTRNEIFDLYKKNLDEKEYNKIMFHLFHWISNPLLFGYEQEFKFCLNHLYNLYSMG